jgi:uncharacterized repeat protein (TIGR01451 family)
MISSVINSRVINSISPNGALLKAKVPGADLVIESIDATNANPMPGDEVFFDVTVRNQGDQKTPPFNVRVTSDGLDQEKRVEGGLGPQASAVLKHLGPLRTNDGQSLYWVEALADADDEVTESNKDNNYMLITVIPQQQPLPPTPPVPPPPPPIPH